MRPAGRSLPTPAVEKPVALVTSGQLLRKDFTDDEIISILSWGADGFKRLLQAIV